ncbi:hypothetical protein [Priestia flexa]|uniref:hypothetical protein n=1 Tax=Priestia flexa TaxID=86664 RepID=UPI00099BAFC4|nr:hypothetical protein [Priestia flexa]AQX54694.1 hypothetical protein BC359_10495 [Priestia flexa]
MYTSEQHASHIQRELEKYSQSVVKELRKVTQFTFHSEIDLLDFTAFPQVLDLSITMFSMDRDANEVFGEECRSDEFAGSFTISEEVNYNYLSEEEEDAFWEFYEENEEVEEAEHKAIASWFYSCWLEAGGSSIKLPSYFSFHDHDLCLDLHQNKWISDGDKWFE